MPRRCWTPALSPLLDAQDQVIGRVQALERGLTADAIGHRLRLGHWRPLLPGTYLAHAGEPSRRQLLVAALVYAGEQASIDAADACRLHGVRAVPLDESQVHVVVPQTSRVRSRGFVVVRRTAADLELRTIGRLRCVDPATAVVAATRGMRLERSVLAAASDAVQRGIVTHRELVRAHVQASRRGALHLDAALERLADGVLSAPEADFAALVAASPTLPRPAYNVRLRLPGGRLVCVDALFTSSAVVHETNGRMAHRREDLFEDMQERHSVLTAVGFVVLHNPPSRITRRGREVIAEVERCHARYAGRGLPPGVHLLAAV